MTELYAAHNNWIKRPEDQRFLDLQDLSNFVHHQHDIARELESVPVRSLKVNQDMTLRMPSGMTMNMTNWSFDQLTRYADAPAGYMRRLPQPVASLNVNVGLLDAPDDAKVLFSHNGSDVVRAFNGVNYGRIWDADVVDAVVNSIDERWGVPLEAYGGVNSKQATTLYASDRDVFIFLTDETRPIEVDGQTYFRGFYTWNSEVGSATFGIATFLFSYVCANRIIWDAKNVSEFKLRHTMFAPERFITEARPYLAAMSEASDRPVIEMIESARNTFVAKTEIGAANWLYRQGFTKEIAKSTVAVAAQTGETGSFGNPTSLWDLVQSGTYNAHGISHTDQRLVREKQFSHLLRFAGKIQPIDDEPITLEDYENDVD